MAWPVYLMVKAKEGFTVMLVKVQGETYSVIVQALLPILKAKRRAYHHYAGAESWQVQLKGDIKCKSQPETTEAIHIFCKYIQNV